MALLMSIYSWEKAIIANDKAEYGTGFVDNGADVEFEDEEEEPASLGFQNPDTVAERVAGGLEGMKSYQR